MNARCWRSAVMLVALCALLAGTATVQAQSDNTTASYDETQSYCSQYEGNRTACDADAACIASEHCATWLSYCQHSNQSSCEAEDGCVWDAAGHCYIGYHPCYDIQDEGSCNTQSECEWHVHCNNATEYGGHGPDDFGHSYCELEECRDIVEQCTGGCNATFQCIIELVQQTDCEDPDVCIDMCRNTTTRTAQEEAVFEELVTCEKRCYATRDCRERDVASCEYEAECSVNRYCFPQDDYTLCQGNSSASCLGESNCEWNWNTSTCYLSSHACFGYGDSASCDGAAEGCVWKEECDLSPYYPNVNGTDDGSYYNGTGDGSYYNGTGDGTAPYYGESSYCSQYEGNRTACDADAACIASEHCATWLSYCQHSNQSSCEAEDGCVWDAAGHCYIGYHPCYDIQDEGSCNTQSECEWHVHCNNATEYGGHGPDDFGHSYCELEECRDIVEQCTGGCNATFQCIIELVQQTDCEDPDVCIDMCRNTTTRTAQEEAVFEELVTCEKRCYLSPECHMATLDQCPDVSYCAITEFCFPVKQDLCTSDSRLSCLSDERCGWDSSRAACYLERHECFSYQDATLCRASSSSCEWRKECEYDEPVPPEDPTKVCMEERCASVIKPCTERADCRAAWEFIGARYENGTCDAECFNDAYAGLSVGAARLLDRAVSCTKTCLGEVECRTTYPTKDECSTSSECEWEQRCAAPEERCSGFLSQSACVQYGSSFCYWDSSVEKCNVNRRSNPCTRYTSSDSCTFNGCQWQEQCTSAPSTATCDADVCRAQIQECNSNDACKQALDCVYNAHANGNGQCDSTCYASCSSYVAGYTFAQSALVSAASCLLDCHDECSPAEQPFIFEKQQCVESTDTVTVNVGSQWEATDRVLRAYCHFYDTDGVCGLSGCMTLGWVAPSSRDGFVSVTCELPDVWDILADGAEVKLRVTLYPSIAQNLVSPFCSSSNSALLTKKTSCAPPGFACTAESVPRIFDVSPECGIGDSSTVNVSVSIDPTYGEDARATCAFWIRNADGRLSCTWHGCYAAATVDAAGDTIMCTLPPSVPEDVSIFVTVQVWHKDNADKQRNQCFSHEGQSSYLWSDYDYGKFTAKCPVPQCTDEYVPRVYGIDPECDLAQDATTIDVSVAIDPTYGDDARATCAFWLPDATGRLSCTWHGCYAAASVNAAGTVITCTLPDGLPPNEEVHVTVQVWHKDNTANKQRNECFSHEGQSSYSWGGFDFGVFSVNCPGPECTDAYVPRVYGIEPACGLEEGAQTVNVSVAIDPTYGADARATCAFWLPDTNNRVSCTWHGCYAAATVNAAGDTIMCTLPEGLPLNEPVRVTVQVWHKDNANKQDNQCFSHEGQSSYHWSEYDSGVFLVNCPAPVCAHDTVPRVYRVNPGCGLDADASTVEVGVWIDPTYGDDARATCAFWRPTSDGSSWQCTWHGCYAPATVDVDRNVITCEVPNGMPASGPVRITVQVWHANNEDKQDNQCFSHEGQSPSQWEAYDYAVLEIRCPAPECRPQYVPRVFEVEPACGLAEDAETVDVSVAIDPSYGVHARATCGFWVEDSTTGALSCTWHGCYAEAAVSSDGDTITCAVPDGLPRNMTVYVTVQVWHRDNEDKQDNQCFSHEGQSPSQWDLRDYGVVEPSCVCPRGVPQVDCPDDLCSDRRCLAYPDAVCVVSNCGRCSVDFYDAVYDSYDDVNSLDCSLRDRCTGECQDKFDACMRYGPCREALYELVEQRQNNGACDEACFDDIPVTTQRAGILLRAIWSCYWKCDAGQQSFQPVCTQPAQPGPCTNDVARWYFDHQTQQCQQFTYGGCGGNSNNFESREACEQRCAVGACCTRRMEPTNGGGYGYGYDRSGYDRYGYNRTGYARDGFSQRPATYAMFARNSYDAYGLDERGYDTRGRDGYGFNIHGYSETYSRDGQQFGYLADEQYDATGRDRAGLDRSGYDRDGYGYDGTYQGAEFSCQQMTRSACQALETGDGQVEVVSFAQGKTCKERRCGNPKWEAPRQCVYGGQRYDFGETFTFGCQTCFCATDGSVSCECSAVTTRREIRDMTVEEVQAFTDAVVLLEQSNMWSAFANTHLGAVPQAHGNPAFWPWHREFLKQLELTLREVSGNCNVTIPYWDWTIDALSPETSPVWNVVGGNGNGVDQCVTDGPFAGFSPCIERNWALGWAMPSFAEIAGILAGTDYSTVVAEIEARHGDVHVFVGGTMATYSSPYDPLFFLHHAFVDKLWYDWQVTLGNGNQYPASMLHMTLDPFAKTAAEVLDSEAQLCVVYAAPGQSPPCNGTAYGGTPETEGYYVNTTRPQYNRDGYDSNGRDVYGRDRYGRGADGEYVDVPVDANNMYGSDRYGFDVRGYDAYGFDENGLDERGCGTGSGAPLYMRDVYRVQRGVYERIQNRTYQPPTRTCRPLQPLPTWWRNINWMRRGDEYQAVIDAYELKVQATYDAKSGQTYRNEYARRPQSYALQDLCFDAGEYVPRPSDDVPGDSYQCPPGVVAYACLRDPCEDATCPGDPTATCRANTCGGCRAEFYVGDGTRAQCHRPCASAYTCDYNPCAQATCEAHPDAVCEFNPCYGCNAVWVNATTGESVECEVEPDPCVSYGESFVCGVDGQTYDNVCYARSAGVEVAYGGVCVSCEERCPEYGAMEACGEDGTTYPSVCHARCANVKVVYPGECQPTPSTCEEVNSLRASDEVRQSVCNSQAACLPTAYRDTDNRCFWNTETRKCSCQPSDMVCVASKPKCVGCCNNDLRDCLRLGESTVTACWNTYLTCEGECGTQFGATDNADNSITDDVRFSIGLPASQSGQLDAEQLAEAISLALGIPNLLPSNVTIRGTGSARRRRASDGVQLEVGVTTGDGNTTGSAVENAVTDGSMAQQVAQQTGSADLDDLVLVGSVAVGGGGGAQVTTTAGGGSGSTGPAPTNPGSTVSATTTNGLGDDAGSGSNSISGGAIGGIVAGVLIVVGAVLAVVFQRGGLVRPQSRVHSAEHLAVNHPQYRARSPIPQPSAVRMDVQPIIVPAEAEFAKPAMSESTQVTDCSVDSNEELDLENVADE